VLKKLNFEAEVFCGDVGTCLSNQCDAIFISEDLYSRIADRATVPVIPIRNFMSNAEITEKTTKFLEDHRS
jgi:PTS system ascorbate-specific IIB component